MKFTPKSWFFFTVIFLFLVTLLLYLAIFVPATSELSLRLLFNEYVLVMGFFLIISTIAFVRFQLRVSKQAKLEKIENFVEGAYKEKLIHRQLEEWEKSVLETRYKETGDNNFDLDRRSPVFRIQGQLIRMPSVRNEAASLEELWSVRGLTISEGSYPDIRYKSFESFPEVVVEFSPFSKYVWDIYGIIGDDRVWSMYLDEKNFELLSKELLKVVVRAPFGNHNLGKLRLGDIVRFVGFGLGREKFVRVDYIRHYQTVEQLLKSEKFTDIYPSAKTVEEVKILIDSYHDYPSRIAKGGIYALKIKYIKFRYQ